MKAIFFAVLAFAATSLAGPIVAERQLETQGDELDGLLAKVQGFTANINKTTAAVPDSPGLLQQTAAADALAPDFQGITDALKSATAVLTKRGLSMRSGGCDSGCLGLKVKALVWEIACTLKFVLVKLGLACVLAYLTPLILALSGLIACLAPVVDGLLLAVKAILDDVLAGLAVGLLGLI